VKKRFPLASVSSTSEFSPNFYIYKELLLERKNGPNSPDFEDKFQ
jgi:hypothetical protein